MGLPTELAAHPSGSRGRAFPEGQSGPRGPRDAFQRDRDRIVHCVSFRRLRQKTQVFVAPDGDHYRVRLTHSIEVAQIGRTIARVLGLNEDLTEALCLAHDLGHPPFGHAGEDALDAALAQWGGFDHNGHTLRLVSRLETPYPDFDGLNLTWEALEGLAKHNGPVARPAWALAEADHQFSLELTTWPSLEAQVAALADDIAYDNHDIDDGLRSGVIDLEALLEVPLVARHWALVDARHPGISLDRKLRAVVRDQIGTMVGDLISETERRVADSGVRSLDEVRHAGQALVGFSHAMAAEERRLKQFLYRNLYNAPQLQPVRREAQRVVSNLAQAYLGDPSLLPERWIHVTKDEVQRARTVADYIAGMTDPFAIRRHEELVGPVELPDRF
ncbi:deoxyguanosinetriphosphate triphosphohydrolase [Sphingomonas arenae]|uniref:deoxyguanosinetriphosphate triphosphohydrolase n=1 Tax=Sphingomonas arenae TaxID=2812555 RepID=UPI0019675B70|nr:deoxyguanosinetriphosphate triphosphohydrolase [Sphingomonas arenae]